MSKTWKTRPLMVRMADKQDNGAGVEEVHDHTNGKCDLPESSYAQLHSTERTRCYYNFKYTGHGVCACNLCSERFERKHSIKKNRQAKRSTIKEQLD